MQGALVIGPGSTSSTQRLPGCCQLVISHKPRLRTSVSITITSLWPVHCKGNASFNDSGHGSHRDGDCRVEQLPVAFNQLQLRSGLGHGVLALQLFQQAVQYCLLCRLQQRCAHVNTTRLAQVRHASVLAGAGGQSQACELTVTPKMPRSSPFSSIASCCFSCSAAAVLASSWCHQHITVSCFRNTTCCMRVLAPHCCRCCASGAPINAPLMQPPQALQ